jgi:hypothetical protein
MARGSMGKHLAGKVVQGGKEGHRSMAVVIMGLGANVSLGELGKHPAGCWFSPSGYIISRQVAESLREVEANYVPQSASTFRIAYGAGLAAAAL